MIVFEHIKRLVECISYDYNQQSISENSDVEMVSRSIERQYFDIINKLNEAYLPLLQFNLEVNSLDEAKKIFSKISQNVSSNTFVPLLPDEEHSKDIIGNLTIEIPSIFEWQEDSDDGQNLVIDYTSETADRGQALLNQLVVNMLLSLPGGSFKLHFVDLAFSAQASYLTKNLDSRLYGKLITSPIDWHQLKETLRAKMAKAMEDYGDVVSYNRNKNKVVVPYDVVVITDFQKCVDEMRDLDALFENGHKGGIYFILMNNLDFMPEEDEEDDSIMALEDSYLFLDAVNYGNYSKKAFIRCTPILDNPFLAKACFEYINKGAEAPQIEFASVDYDTMLGRGFESINESITIPVGSTDKGELENFTLNTVSHIHCFIIGQSGTGKTVFLHDVIVGAMSKYSPEELELYLMDFKIGGVEFNRYKNEKHVKALLVDNSDIQITLEILREINNKMRERGKLLRSCGVSNIVEYNDINPDNRMPRIVLIADECHVMFPTMSSKEVKLYREISDILAKIAKEGRSQGVHLVLATQTIAQAEIPSEVINNISDFYLLKCSSGDSERLVSGSSETTGQLKTGQVLHHDIDNNTVFKSNHIERKAAMGLIKKINEKTKAFDNDQFYFVGSQIFNIDDEVKRLLATQSGIPVIAFGRSIDTKMEPVMIPLRKEYGDNVMLFGINDEEQVSRTTMASIQSLRLSNKKIKIKVINCLPSEQKNTNKLLSELAKKREIELLNPSRCGTELVNIATSIKNRDAEQMVLYILGQERFRELRMDMEIASEKPKQEENEFKIINDFGPTSSADSAFNSYQRVIEYILKNGAEIGVHIIMQIDKPKQLLFADYMSSRDFFNMFHHLVMLKCDDNAVNTLGLSDDLRLENLSSDIERLRAIYYNETNNSYTLFTPFDF